MKIEHNPSGINPTAQFIDSQHTGKFVELLPGTYLIKGAINDRGFDQAYAVTNNNRKELILIDVVEEVYREAVETIVKDGYNIKAILITGKTVLNDAYADLETLAEDAGGAEIYLHPDIKPETDFKTHDLVGSDALLNSFKLKVFKLPANKHGEVIIFSDKNDGMLFVGDSVKGSNYNDDTFIFSREKQEKQSNEFEISEYWQTFSKAFTYFFPRMGKPAIEVDSRTRNNILNRISRGAS